MSEQHNESNEQRLTGHNYDGIQEYDNPTPAWWTWIFLVSIVFTPIYMIFTLMSDGALTPQGQYERAYVKNLEKKFGELGTLQPDAVTLVKYSKDQQWLAFGANVYQTHCISCHGSSAGGNSGPNLTDNAFINVKKIEDIADVILNGRKNGAMPAWGNRLHPNEIVLVSAYIASLKDTNVAGGKPAEGEVLPGEWSSGQEPEPDTPVQ